MTKGLTAALKRGGPWGRGKTDDIGTVGKEPLAEGFPSKLQYSSAFIGPSLVSRLF